MRRCLAALALLAAVPAAAQTAVAPSNVTAGDVVAKPLDDLNLRRDEIPLILIAARDDTYAVKGLRSCRALGAEIGRLDAVLGPDIDVAADQSLGEKRGNAVGALAKSVIGSFIPFGGVIREVTGAAARERQWQVALYAGTARRAYLKGYGQARGCRYPARAATPAQAAAAKAIPPETAVPPPGLKSGVRKARRRNHR